jgi:hypothetical protein
MEESTMNKKLIGIVLVFMVFLCACQDTSPEGTNPPSTEPSAPNQFLFSDGSIIEYTNLTQESDEIITFTFIDVNDPQREFTEEEKDAIIAAIAEMILGEGSNTTNSIGEEMIE